MLKWLKRQTKRSNCLIYGGKKVKKHGGYLAWRWTKWNKWKKLKWPHLLWMPAICPDKGEPCPHFRSFVPRGKKKVCIVPPPLFHGKVIKGDRDTGPEK